MPIFMQVIIDMCEWYAICSQKPLKHYQNTSLLSNSYEKGIRRPSFDGKSMAKETLHCLAFKLSFINSNLIWKNISRLGPSCSHFLDELIWCFYSILLFDWKIGQPVFGSVGLSNDFMCEKIWEFVSSESLLIWICGDFDRCFIDSCAKSQWHSCYCSIEITHFSKWA